MKVTAAMVRGLFPKRDADAHKGDFGHLLIVAGSRGMGGAAALAALGGIRSGAGLVTVAVPESVQSGVAAVAPEALTLGLPESDGALAASAAAALKKALDGKTAVALGPGLTTKKGAVASVFAVLEAAKGLEVVLDADALNALALHPAKAEKLLKARKTPVLLTPHPGELARLMKSTVASIQKDREKAARAAAKRFGAVVLLKGHGTVVTDGSGLTVNPTGNPGMAKGGMGDVLTGLVGGLLAQYGARLQRGRDVPCVPAGGAGVACAYLHGLAGDLAARKVGRTAMTARDLAEALPEAERRVVG